MKRFNVLSWALLLVLCGGFVSCDKDDDGGSGGEGNPESLLIGKWQPVSIGSFGLLEDYQKDDILEFKANKTVIYDENGTYHYPFEVALPILNTQTTWSIRYSNVLGEWVLNFVEDDILVRGFPYQADFNIEEITSTKLVLFNGLEYEFRRIN